MKKSSVNKAEIKSALRSVEKALGALEIRVKDGSATDLVRLLQLRKELMEELTNEGIEEIRVTWVEPKAESVSER
jgi:hypothetical protein